MHFRNANFIENQINKCQICHFTGCQYNKLLKTPQNKIMRCPLGRHDAKDDLVGT